MKRLRQEEQHSHRRFTGVIKFAAIFLLAVLVLEVWMVNRLATYGQRTQDLKNAQASLILENQILENRIAEKSSLLSLEKKAVELGFQNIKSLQYFQPNVLASNLP